LLAPIHLASISKSPATPSAQIEKSVRAERNVVVGQYLGRTKGVGPKHPHPEMVRHEHKGAIWQSRAKVATTG
jgi:hypothetical protein